MPLASELDLASSPEEPQGQRASGGWSQSSGPSEVDGLIAVERGERALLAAGAAGEIVSESEPDQRGLEVAEVEVRRRCEPGQHFDLWRQLGVDGGGRGARVEG
jgi:hypothetical protein